MSLRDRLIGTWKLISYVEVPVDGGAPSYPFGEDAAGLLIYSRDGYMSAQLMRTGRRPFASGTWAEGTDDEYREEAASYIAYSGTFEVDEEQRTLLHSMHVSLFPNWIGQTQPRTVSLDGDTLQLGTATPTRRGGRLVLARLTWQRAAPLL